jgi:hypothetical protein
MQRSTLHLWNQLAPERGNKMRGALLRLIVPAWVAILVLLVAYDLGVPMEFIVAFAMFAGWVLGRNVEI